MLFQELKFHKMQLISNELLYNIINVIVFSIYHSIQNQDR